MQETMTEPRLHPDDRAHPFSVPWWVGPEVALSGKAGCLEQATRPSARRVKVTCEVVTLA